MSLPVWWRMSAAIVAVLARCGRPGNWLIHRLGWREFVSETFHRPHHPQCAAPRPVLLLRPHGWVKRCETCDQPVELHFACWETEGGAMPEEVTRWILAEVQGLPRVPS